MAAPNSSELQLLSEFRKRISDIKLNERQQTDMELLRWIRARENKLEKAEQMLRKAMKWKAENNIDEILSWQPPEDINFPVDITGSDNDGCPLFIRPIGFYDLGKIASDKYLKEMYLKSIFQAGERLLEMMRGRVTADGTPVSQVVMIVDYCNMSAGTFLSVTVVKFLMELSRQVEAAYPEIIKATYFINASQVATVIFGILKPILSQRTMDKFRVFGTNAAEWKQALLEQIPADQLPTFLGGTRIESPLNSLYQES